MTKYVVDAGALIEIVTRDIAVSPDHQLLAPTLVRSQLLSLMHEAVARGDLDDKAALAHLERINRMSIRLLGDGVLRRTAWKVADQLGWPSTYGAEYIALTQLQGEALITTDAALATAAATLVSTATVDALT
jgi:indolepyruvate ferredoxin oxidoreductase alpha subunit